MFHCPDNLCDLPVVLKWHCAKVTPQAPHTGVIGGPVVHVPTHFYGATVPCCRIITNGEVSCCCDESPTKVRRSAYIPIIGDKGDRLVFLVTGEVGDNVKKWPVGTVVQVRHPAVSRRPMIVERLHVDAIPKRVREGLLKGAPHDIREYLCHLWQLRHLTEHYGFTYRPAERLAGRRFPAADAA